MACLQVCPMSCIHIEKDSAGNIYPKINPDQCISCGKCRRSCPALNPPPLHSSVKAYAVWSLDDQDRKSSTSGAAASVFYQEALSQGAWICGVKYEKDFHVNHILTNDPGDIAHFKQSKYVFSETNHIYQSIQEKLMDGEKVLFISLPCKVAGLLQFLGKSYDNLLTVDIVCHGTPSYDRLFQHIETVAHGEQIQKLRFRNENEFAFELTNQSQTVYRKMGRQDPYLAAFLEGLGYRPSCYQCAYARQKRLADLTICDFWGLGQEIPFEHPYTGAISAVLINSDSGQRFFEQCKTHLFWEERQVQEVLKGNAQLNHPTPIHAKSKQFEQVYFESGLEQAVQICLKEEISADRKQLRQRELRKKLRKTAGVFLKRYRG